MTNPAHFAAMLGMGFSVASDDDSEIFTAAEQIAALKKVHEQIVAGETENSFAPGDIIVHRFPEHANVKQAAEPAMFAGFLEYPVDMSNHPEGNSPGSSVMGMVLDCRVTKVDEDSEAHTYLADSRVYRLWTEEDDKIAAEREAAYLAKHAQDDDQDAAED